MDTARRHRTRYSYRSNWPGLAIAKSPPNASRSRVASKPRRPQRRRVREVAWASSEAGERSACTVRTPIIDVGQSPQPKGFWGGEAACNCPGVRSTR
jgi:hypothetical protein